MTAAAVLMIVMTRYNAVKLTTMIRCHNFIRISHGAGHHFNAHLTEQINGPRSHAARNHYMGTERTNKSRHLTRCVLLKKWIGDHLLFYGLPVFHKPYPIGGTSAKMSANFSPWLTIVLKRYHDSFTLHNSPSPSAKAAHAATSSRLASSSRPRCAIPGAHPAAKSQTTSPWAPSATQSV
jgi:hypothetical protein